MVGGIPNQIIHKLTGALVHSVDGCAYQMRYLLTHPDFCEAAWPERPRACERKLPDDNKCPAMAAADSNLACRRPKVILGPAYPIGMSAVTSVPRPVE